MVRGSVCADAGRKPALVWSAPNWQGECDAGKVVQLHTCIRLGVGTLGSRALMNPRTPHLISQGLAS